MQDKPSLYNAHSSFLFYKDETFPADTLQHSKKIPAFISEDKVNIFTETFWTQSGNIKKKKKKNPMLQMFEDKKSDSPKSFY